jgi:hypothetical protein
MELQNTLGLAGQLALPACRRGRAKSPRQKRDRQTSAQPRSRKNGLGASFALPCRCLAVDFETACRPDGGLALRTVPARRLLDRFSSDR